MEARRVFPRLTKLLRIWKLARVASVLALLLLNFTVYRWADELYGPAAGLACSIMVVLSPNLIAHGTLAATDGYFALGVLGSLYCFRKYLLCPTLRNAGLSGLTLALAQTTKPFAIYLYPIVYLFLVLAALIKRRTASSLTPKELILYAGISAASLVAVIDVSYCFDRPFTPFRSYHFVSFPFIHAQQIVQAAPGGWRIRVPLAYPFLQGLDMMKFNETHGTTYGNVYLLGELRSASDPLVRGFKSYYAVALVFKEPIALQVLVVLGLLGIRKKRSVEDIVWGEGLLIAAASALILWLSFFDKAQIGIRHILPALAIGVVIAGAAFSNFASFSRTRKGALGLLLLWLCVSTLSYYPHLIPYMNEWVIDRRLAYRILGDSNLSYGQNADLVQDFLKRNPDVILNPETPTCGRVLIDTNRLLGISPRDKEPLSWALRYHPMAHVGYAHLLYFIPADSGADDDAALGPSCSAQ
jgi:hypothetical protein